jgi:PAS domain S-box-containing protein
MENTIDKNNFEQIFDKVIIAVAICELIIDKQGHPIDYRFLKINDAFEKQSGMLIETSIGKTIKEIFPDVEQSWIEKYGSAVINNKPISFVDFNQNTNKFYNASAFKLSGNTFAMYFEDITTQKNIESQLQQKQINVEALINHTDDIILSIDRNFNIIDFNNGFRDIVLRGLSPEPKIGDYILNLTNSNLHQKLKDIYTKVLNGEKIIDIEEYPIARNSKTLVYFETSYHPIIEEAAIVGISIFSKNIAVRIQKENELKLAKEKAEASEKRYSGILNNLESGIVVHAPDTSILMNNSKASELLGLSERQMKGKEAIDPAWKFVDESNVPLLIEKYPVNRIINGEKSLQNQVIGIYRPNMDDIVWTAVNGCPILYSTGAISEIIISFIDITKRKQAEKLTIETNRLNAIGEMAASVAHDFNNSLQLMIGSLEIIKLQSDLSTTSNEHISSIESLIKDVASRTRALQSFGDVNETDNNKKLETLDLNRTAAETISQSRPLWKDQIEKKGLKINFLTDYGDIPKIIFNKGSLSSIIFNLIKNSVEAMPEGGTIQIKTGIKNEGVFLTCMDTGIGMTEESQLKIFQPYYSTKGYEIGRGLGMSGVYNLLKKAKGSIKVIKTGVGEGATIEIFFSINSMEKIKSIDETLPKKVASLSVLYVDDEFVIGLNSQRAIELSGHQCDVETSAADALITLDKKKYDVVITDIGMPEMNGWEFATIIRKKFGDTIKIIAASGWEIDKKELIKSDVNYSLMKPYSSEEIGNILSKIHKL